ncbi:MAG: hypothetical protein ACRCUB_19275, partial [Plesiomonas shigelloides]
SFCRLLSCKFCRYAGNTFNAAALHSPRLINKALGKKRELIRLFILHKSENAIHYQSNIDMQGYSPTSIFACS